jgi:HSP20 family protein
MIKRIKPVARGAKVEGDVRRLIDEVMSERRELSDFQGGWVPHVDVYERGDEIVVEAEVPGMSSKDIVVALHMSRIEIKGWKKEERVLEDFRYLRLERAYGKFERALPLPCAVHPDKAKANLENGILTIVLKKQKQARGKEVVVKISKTQE